MRAGDKSARIFFWVHPPDRNAAVTTAPFTWGGIPLGRRKGYYTVEGALDGEGAEFTCTVRRGAVYEFRTRADGA